ncbi:NHRF1 protein, partial [Hylia prasina]|nr:NHRF1 protein [Hylia prasina]
SSGAGPAARLCRLERGSDGYGFHLHGEKGKPGQFIRLVEAGSPAGPRTGLRAAGTNPPQNTTKNPWQRVFFGVETAGGHPRMVSLPLQQLSGVPGTVLGCWGVWEQFTHRLFPLQEELRPRLCHMKKGPDGYGFNLHSDKSRPGQFVRAVDVGSPAEAAGLAPQDRIIEVNGVCMEGKQHSDVVAAIKASGDETRLLVVDVLTDEFFKKCKVVPSEQHLTGPLPEPVANGDIGKENGREPQSSLVSESPSSPTPLAVTPDSSETHSKEGDKHHSAPGSLLDLDIPLAVAKERAHQKRTSKRAPQMDWSKKNELFSNL